MTPPSSRLHVFVGPTAADLPADWRFPSFCVCHPPIKRGDIQALVAEAGPPASLLIVDGVFHSQPAVGHAEIANALRQGWSIWGSSSMGAIRAVEMAPLGMRGFGRVYTLFQEQGLDDDEVTLLHEADEPYTALSEPLVHLRELLGSLRARSLLSAEAHAEILASLKNRWYGHRTLRALGHLLQSLGQLAPDLVSRELAEIRQHRIKTLDVLDFFRQVRFTTRQESTP